MNFITYDLIFLGIFAVFLALFLYRGKKNVKREGILLLYKTSWGIKLIKKIGTKYSRALKTLSYVSIFVGYILMAGAIYFVGKIVWLYLFNSAFVQAVKVPPITPLVPYITNVMDLGLPPFYFTYWIIIIAIIAIFHEFAHGIFAARDRIKIKKTGFGFFPFFLPIFLAAFVEPDEKQIEKKSKFSQLAVLSAGTFANVLTAVFFFIIMILFFFLAFQPTGITYDDYVYSSVPINSITRVNNVSLENPTYDKFISVVNGSGRNTLFANGVKFVGVKDFSNDLEKVFLYSDTPAANARLETVIFKINNQKVTNIEELARELSKYSPGERITLNVLGTDGEDYNRDIVLAQHPKDASRAMLGIAFLEKYDSGLIGSIIAQVASFKNPHTYYEPKIDGLSIFIYNLLWWIVLISISVAILNMLPVGIFDGGRFFYLTVLGITKNKKLAEKSFKFLTQLVLFLILVVMLAWVVRVFL